MRCNYRTLDRWTLRGPTGRALALLERASLSQRYADPRRGDDLESKTESGTLQLGGMTYGQARPSADNAFPIVGCRSFSRTFALSASPESSRAVAPSFFLQPSDHAVSVCVCMFLAAPPSPVPLSLSVALVAIRSAPSPIACCRISARSALVYNTVYPPKPAFFVYTHKHGCSTKDPGCLPAAIGR